MSNSLAVATVTASLAELISRFIDDSQGGTVPGAYVTFLEPSSQKLQNGDAIVNIFLYRVSTNAELANQDLPMRDASGRPTNTPRLAINLDYVLSFFGDQATLVPQRLLGSVASGLHAIPVLGPAIVSAAVDHYGWLKGSDLATQVERIKFTPSSMTPDQMSWFWQEFKGASYQLSTLYQATVVFLDKATPTPAALPVRRIALTGAPGPSIAIDRIVNADRLKANDTMTIIGSGFDAPGLAVIVNEEPATIARVEFPLGGRQRITVALKPEAIPNLATGPLAVRVISRSPSSGRAAGSERASSLTEMAMLYPVFTTPPIAVPAASGAADASYPKVVVEVTPPVRADQSVVLLLNLIGGMESLRVPMPAPLAPTTRFEVPVAPPVAGNYLVRFSVDRFETALATQGGRYVAPFVTLPAVAS